MKQKITRENYESFFLDYLEGNLEEILIDQFLDFLEQNPDLKEELHLFENIHLPEPPLAYPGKKQLYKTPADEKDAFNLKAVARMEGDLQEEERQQFDTFLALNPELQKEAALFEHTRLQADPTITYPGKDKLYKNSSTVILINWLGRIAAVAILLWGMYFLFQNEKQVSSPTRYKSVASVKTPDKTAPGVESPKAETQTETLQPAENKPAPPTQKELTQADPVAAKEPLATHQALEHERLELEQIPSLAAQLQSIPVEGELAAIQPPAGNEAQEPHKVMSVEEYLASRAKKATSESLRPAHRILRVGLNAASELSGDRIEYSVKNGKVTSLGFDSKLLAFSIPLQKNKK